MNRTINEWPVRMIDSVFDREKVAESRVKKNKQWALINNQKSVEMSYAVRINNFGYCDQSEIGVEKYELKAFNNHQKPEDMAHTCTTGISNIVIKKMRM